MNLSRPLKSSVLLLTIAMSSLTINASELDQQYPHRYGMEGKEIKVDRIMQHLSLLDLSAKQTTEIEKLIQSSADTSKPLRKKLKALHSEMRKIKQSETINEPKIRRVNNDIAIIKTELTVIHLKTKKHLESLLNDKQKEKYKKIRALKMDKKKYHKKRANRTNQEK